MLAALAQSGSRITAPLESEDCDATAEALRALGCEISRFGETVVVEPQPMKSPVNSIDCGNSGTTMRLLAGILAGQVGVEAELIGDASLSRRPMGRIREPLIQMGAEIEGEHAPIRVSGQKLNGIRYRSPMASAQVKSAILLAGLSAAGETWVSEPSPSRDHTERMLAALGVDVIRGPDGVGVRGGQCWRGFTMTVPGDISSAAFLIVAGTLIPGSRIELSGVGINPTRTGILDVMSDVGASIRVEETGESLGEPFANLTIEGATELKPFVVFGDLVPRLIDEIPVLAVMATQCDGVTEIRDAAELRVKESDRIAVVADALQRMGAELQTREDGLVIAGPTSLKGTEIDAAGDHRIGMAFAVAGMIAEGETTIHNAHSIRTSYPAFTEHLARLQGDVR